MSASGAGLKRKASSSSDTPLHPHKMHKPHAPEFKDFLHDVKAALRAVTPTGTGYYSQVVVVMLSWRIGDPALNIKPSYGRIKDVFENLYGYKVVEYVLEEHHADLNTLEIRSLIDLGKLMDQYRATDTKNKTLFVHYYSGHGVRETKFSKKLIIYPNPANVNCYLHWEALSMNFKPTDCNHSLAILDCCSSGVANIGDNVELLAAASWDNAASSHAKHNFTNSLVSVLRQNPNMPRTVADIYNGVLEYEQRQGLRKTQPIHRTSADKNMPSIVLKPLGVAPTPLPVITKGKGKAATGTHAVVTISVTIDAENTVPDAKAFEKWVTTEMPAGLSRIKIRAKWRSSSVTILVALPVQIWLFLPDRDAYTFVSLDYETDSEQSGTTVEHDDDDDVSHLPLTRLNMNIPGGRGEKSGRS